MKKNIAIIVLSLLSLFLILFSYIKGKEAEKNLILARNSMKEAQLHKTKAEEEAANALRIQTISERVQADAERTTAELKACRSGN